MKKKLVFLLFIIFSKNLLYGDAHISLLQTIKNNPVGSYIILEHNQTHVAIVLKEKQAEALVFHEMCFPKNSAKNRLCWQERLSHPKNTFACFAAFETVIRGTHVITKPIFLKKTKNPTKDHLISLTSILTSLNFRPISEKKIRMTKDASNYSVPWKPQLIINGESRQYARCGIYEAYLTKEHAKNSTTRIEIYLPEVSNKEFLYFPIWMEIEGPLGKTKIRAVDSGIIS